MPQNDQPLENPIGQPIGQQNVSNIPTDQPMNKSSISTGEAMEEGNLGILLNFKNLIYYI